MCARYTLRSPADLFAERFGLLQVPVLTARYNIAPSQLIPVIGAKAGGGRGLGMFKWGFLPHWAQDDRPFSAFTNRLRWQSPAACRFVGPLRRLFEQSSGAQRFPLLDSERPSPEPNGRG